MLCARAVPAEARTPNPISSARRRNEGAIVDTIKSLEGTSPLHGFAAAAPAVAGELSKPDARGCNGSSVPTEAVNVGAVLALPIKARIS